jgi:hypothetical protein
MAKESTASFTMYHKLYVGSDKPYLSGTKANSYSRTKRKKPNF